MRTKMVRGLLVGAVLLAAAGVATAETPYTVEWSRQLGTWADDRGYCVAVDGSGNAFISGVTKDSLAAPNPAGWGSDSYLAKYDSSGNLLWTRQLGTSAEDEAYSVVVDASGSVYMSGLTTGSIGGTNAGSNDAFLAKYDSSGNLLWTRQLGTSGADTFGPYGRAAVDASGSVYISGCTTGSLGGPQAGIQDAFLVKYNSSGSLLWTRQLGTSAWDGSWSVAVDGAGGVYISGNTYGSLGGPQVGEGDAFLAKYDSSGSLLWTRQLGTPSLDGSSSLAVDGAGGVYMSGGTQGSLGGPTAGGAADAFLAKYNISGDLLWTRQLGTSSHDWSNSLAVDGDGGVYITGETSGSLGGPQVGGADVFLAKYNSLGNLLWIQQIGTSAGDGSWSVAVDGEGGVFISGSTDGSLGGPSAGAFDAFLVKFTPEPATLGLLAVGLGAIWLKRRRR